MVVEPEGEAKRARLVGFDADDAPDMVASMMEVTSEELMREICALLDEQDQGFDEYESEWCLNQPGEIDPQKVLAARAVEGDRLRKFKVYEEIDESEYDP